MPDVILTLILTLGGYTEDVYHLACAIAGEAPHLVSADIALAERVGQVVLNRLHGGWCSSIQHCVDSGFWGAATVDVPPVWAFEAAEAVLERNETTGDFYVFSWPDTRKLGLLLDDSNFYQCNAAFCLAFYGRDTRW